MTTQPFTEQERAIAEFLATAYRMADETGNESWFDTGWPKTIRRKSVRTAFQHQRGPFHQTETRATAQRGCILAARDRLVSEWPTGSGQRWAEVIAYGAQRDAVESLETARIIKIAHAGGEPVGEFTGRARSYLVQLTDLGGAIARDMEVL